MRLRHGFSGLSLLLLLDVTGCPAKRPRDLPEPAADMAKNLNPYKDVAPKKVGADVEKIQQQEEQRNDKRLEEAK